ncbi:MAG: NRDE family protein, partial [Flammeovirgaceae bacterium]
LLVGNADELWYLSNYQNKIQQLSNGIYGLSNHLLDTPWPKVANGKRMFLELMRSKHLKASELFEFLFNMERAPDNELPDTGIGLEKERLLSSMFIKSNGYGTRSSTVVLVKYTGEVHYTERLYDLNTFAFKDVAFQFQLN